MYLYEVEDILVLYEYYALCTSTRRQIAIIYEYEYRYCSRGVPLAKRLVRVADPPRRCAARHQQKVDVLARW
jgi:hypothetical protein